MAEASTSRSSRTLHENNVAMLLQKLKELRMDGGEGPEDDRVYAKIESKHLQFFK